MDRTRAARGMARATARPLTPPRSASQPHLRRRVVVGLIVCLIGIGPIVGLVFVGLTLGLSRRVLLDLLVASRGGDPAAREPLRRSPACRVAARGPESVRDGDFRPPRGWADVFL